MLQVQFTITEDGGAFDARRLLVRPDDTDENAQAKLQLQHNILVGCVDVMCRVALASPYDVAGACIDCAVQMAQGQKGERPSNLIPIKGATAEEFNRRASQAAQRGAKP